MMPVPTLSSIGLLAHDFQPCAAWAERLIDGEADRDQSSPSAECSCATPDGERFAAHRAPL